MCNQIPVKIKISRANFISKMSKLFGWGGGGGTEECLSKLIYKVGRVGTPNLDICPYFRSFYVTKNE